MKNYLLPKLLFLLIYIFLQNKVNAQIGINDDGTAPAGNAMLDIKSTTKGLLIPRMSTQERLLLAPTQGLTVYDTTTNGFWYYNGAVWVNLATVSSDSPWLTTGNNISNSNTGNVGVGTTTPTDKLSIVNALPGYGVTHSYGPVTMGTFISNLNAQFGTKTNHPLQFFTNNGNAQMTLLQNGNVGIGSTTPTERLSVVNALPGYGVTHTYGPVTMGSYISNLNAQFGTKTNHPLQFFTNNGSAQMTLLQNGNVGLGVTAPQTILHVNPDGAGGILVGANKTSGGFTNLEMGISTQSGGYSYLQSIKASGSTWGDIAFNPSGGRVSIGTTVNNLNTKLTVSQDAGNYNGILAEGKGTSNSAIYAKGNLGADAIVIDGPIRSLNTNSKVIYQMVTQTSSPSSNGYLSDSYHPGIPGLPDGHVTILIDNPLCNNDPNAIIFYNWIGVYENNKNFQSFLTYDIITGRWRIKYNYDTYFGPSTNQVPAFNIMIVKQ